MDISVTAFKRRCLEIIRHVEATGRPVAITRRGRIVARVLPSAASTRVVHPWERLRSMGGRLLAAPGESALRFAKSARKKRKPGALKGKMKLLPGWDAPMSRQELAHFYESKLFP